MSPRHNPLDAQATFLASWDWLRFLAAWRETVGSLPEPLVAKVPVAAPHLFRLAQEYIMHLWWPADAISTKQARFQMQLLSSTNSNPLIFAQASQRAGERQTVELLADMTAADEQAALLIGAALRPYTNMRGYGDASRPLRRILSSIETWAWPAAGLSFAPWHHASTQVLPGDKGFLNWEDLEDGTAVHWTGERLVQALGAYHRELLAAWRPVMVVIDSQGDPALVKTCQETLARLQEEEEAQNAARQAERAAHDEAVARQREEYHQQHPRAKEWPPTADVLRELVWSMPTIEVANLFGVSDVAVAKLCAKRGVPKPPRGFWRKVEAGQVKHPNGRIPKGYR